MSTNATKWSPVMTKFLNHIKNGKGFDSIVMKQANILSLGDGKCKAEFTVSPEYANFINQLHGGCTATVMDTVTCLALGSKGKVGVTVNYNIIYKKSAYIGDEVIVEANTTKIGQNLAFIEAEVKNKKTGDLLASSTHSIFLLQTFKSSY